MHCRPAFDGIGNGVGRKLLEQTGRTFLEVSDDVVESPQSIVVDQAENRLHTIKAVIVATIGA
jgi:ornithine carbamoyltransferase